METFTLVFSTNQDPFELIVVHVKNAKDMPHAYEQAFERVLKFCQESYTDCEDPYLSYVGFKGLCNPDTQQPDLII